MATPKEAEPLADVLEAHHPEATEQAMTCYRCGVAFTVWSRKALLLAKCVPCRSPEST